MLPAVLTPSPAPPTPSAGNPYSAGGEVLNHSFVRLGLDENDVEGAWAMDALDAIQLDVAGGGRTADPGERAAGIQPGHCLGDQADHLLGPHQAQVVVGDEGKGTPPLAG